jgi:hypothetical protein
MSSFIENLEYNIACLPVNALIPVTMNESNFLVYLKVGILFLYYAFALDTTLKLLVLGRHS